MCQVARLRNNTFKSSIRGYMKERATLGPTFEHKINNQTMARARSSQ